MNVRGTHHLLEALHAASLSPIVLIPGSAMVYRPSTTPIPEDHDLLPPNPYGLSKLAQELLAVRALADGIDVRIGRAFNHIGPRQDPEFAASGFARQIAEIEAGRREPRIVVGNLSAEREAIDVRDTVRAYRAILERGSSGRPYNVSSGRAYPVGEARITISAVAVQIRRSRASVGPDARRRSVAHPRRDKPTPSIP